MVKSPNCYACLFVLFLLVDFYYYVTISFFSGGFYDCPMPLMFIELNQVEFIMFWVTVILCSLPIKSDAFQIITTFLSLAFLCF